MSPKTKKFYEFANFRLDNSRKVLLRDGNPVPLTPKVFDTLEILIENAGELIGKDELIKRIWQEYIVEESNLTSNIKMLRKALGDDAASPQFIETVPRRGYRFIAKVNETYETSSHELYHERLISKPIEKNTDSLLKKTLLPAVCILIVGIFVFVFWFSRGKNVQSGAHILSAQFNVEKLSTNGKVLQAVISNDGKNVIYTNGSVNEKQSVWLRQLDSGNNVEIIPPSDDIYYGLALSPDGNFLYFSRRTKGAEEKRNIYRISIFGGVPTKIVGETEGWISVSPDGGKISFVRCYNLDEELCSLWIADALDGKNERKLVSRPSPFRIGGNSFAPDGKTIAFASGQSDTAANEFGLMEVDVESGAERKLTAQKFFNIRSLAWLPDRSGLLIVASQIPNKNYRIWYVKALTGEVQSLTKDSESYSVLSLDKAAKLLISTQVKQDFHMLLYQKEKPNSPRVLADASKVTFAPNGIIIFSSIMSGNDEIWSVNPDGSGQRQLTNNAADDGSPIVSPDNSWIFFASNRTGEAQVWRMNADGSNQMQITQTEGGYPLSVSPDSKWLFYRSALNGNLRRVSAKGGEEKVVLDKRKIAYAVSPDGQQAAFAEMKNDEIILTVVSLSNGETVKTLNLGDRTSKFLLELVWLHDGKNLAYILAIGENDKYSLWVQPLDGKSPRQIPVQGDERINSFAFMPDGKSFVITQGEWRHDAVLLKGLK